MMTDCDRKQIIGELQKIQNELGIIDFLRKHFSKEYTVFFEKEKEEEKNAENSINLGDDYIRKYTWRILERDMPKKLNIRNEYMRVNDFTIIIFFEHLVIPFNTGDEGDIIKNEKIKESRKVYAFYRGLIANDICKLNKYPEAIQKLGLWDLPQGDFDSDDYHIRHDTYAQEVLQKHLKPFIDEYKNYL